MKRLAAAWVCACVVLGSACGKSGGNTQDDPNQKPGDSKPGPSNARTIKVNLRSTRM